MFPFYVYDALSETRGINMAFKQIKDIYKCISKIKKINRKAYNSASQNNFHLHIPLIAGSEEYIW